MSAETELIKERLDIAELVGEYVQLKQAGRHFKGLCPFHNEKTPSFVVSPDKGIYHCFGCGEGGDIFAFIQRVESIEFPDALRQLAERAGVTLPDTYSSTTDPRQRLFDMMALAAKFHHELLVGQKVGTKAQAYLAERGVRPETIIEFQLGYAPRQWDTAATYLRSKGYTDAELVASGLVNVNQQGKAYDRFRARIMFPINDVRGRVIAFGGRIVPWYATGNEGKYINSPETSIYSKRQVVYNLQRAKQTLRKHEPCLVVEGYLDVVMVHQAGHHNVVASSGTAFTVEQVTLLKRYTSTLHFAFDADTAGVAAAEAATQTSVQAGMRVATVVFPAGQDPADVAQDSQQLAACLATPRPLVNLLLDRLQTTDTLDRDQVLGRLLPLVKSVTNVVHQGEMVQQIASALHVPESLIVARLATAVVSPTVSVADTSPENPPAAGIEQSAQYILLGLLISEPDTRSYLWPVLRADTFSNDTAGQLFMALQQLAKDQPLFMQATADQVLMWLPKEQLTFAEALRSVAAEHISRLDEHKQGVTGIQHEAMRMWQGILTTALTAKLTTLQQQLANTSITDQAPILREFQITMEELSVVTKQVALR